MFSPAIRPASCFRGKDIFCNYNFLKMYLKMMNVQKLSCHLMDKLSSHLLQFMSPRGSARSRSL